MREEQKQFIRVCHLAIRCCTKPPLFLGKGNHMTHIEKTIRRKLLRSLVRRIRIMREMRSNTFYACKLLCQEFRRRHRAMV